MTISTLYLPIEGSPVGHKILAYVKGRLEETGCAVDTVFTGKEAIDWAEPAPTWAS